MARYTSPELAVVWRAVILVRHGAGQESKTYCGPFVDKRAATSAVSRERRNCERYRYHGEFVNGWVESAPLGDWQKEN